MGEGRGTLKFTEFKTYGCSSALVSTGPHVPALTSTAPRRKLVSKGEAEELTDRGVEVGDIFLVRRRV